MDTEQKKQQVAETGRILLSKGLVARTWGNISCRVNENQFAITPSGLDYTHMKAKDITLVDMATLEWTGSRKPSSEKGVHQAAYQIFPEVQFVIHTHQTYATAISVAGFEGLKLTKEEREKLGKIALAGYGLPGTKKLKQNVRTALETGAQVVLMAHHGAVVGGTSREDTMEKVRLLEEICKRNVGECRQDDLGSKSLSQMEILQQQYECIHIATTPAIMQAITLGGVQAQLDDMAQMIGRTIPVVAQEDVVQAIKKYEVVFVPDVGAVIRAKDEDDAEAMEMLVEKAAVCRIHTKKLGVKGKLPWIDTTLMRLVYQKKYSKQKEG